MNNSLQRYCVLLIEDNPGDVRLTQEAFREIGDDVDLQVVMDGVEAVAYLLKKGEYRDKPVPDLILLDLNLPKWGGRQVLEKVKNDPLLRRIPIVVLTTSNASADVLACYDLHANCFINKPVDFDNFFKTIQRIKIFWLQTATLPSNAS
ncbi:MAG: response regulator [Bacteroidetes bacterium]|nr:MAG: response regulator [Bacteroidota bacterium]PTM09970.1 MAG: response regulator [Bacteroidota bacterium]